MAYIIYYGSRKKLLHKQINKYAITNTPDMYIPLFDGEGCCVQSVRSTAQIPLEFLLQVCPEFHPESYYIRITLHQLRQWHRHTVHGIGWQCMRLKCNSQSGTWAPYSAGNGAQ